MMHGQKTIKIEDGGTEKKIFANCEVNVKTECYFEKGT
jgi:hypothetical protein